ncbi:MAG: glycosyltransferase family protein [Spirochaetaceae bacterium]
MAARSTWTSLQTLVFSCTGEGMGHAARVAALASELSARYRIVIFAPRNRHRFLRSHVPGATLYDIPYFAFVKKNERVEYVRTLMHNVDKLLRFHITVRRMSRLLRRIGPAACVSDYDPFIGFAARRLGIPVLQLNHPSIVLRSPSLSFQAITAKLLSWFLMGYHDKRVLCSFYNGDVGPIVRRSLTQRPIRRDDFFVVYLKPSYRRVVTRKLRELGITNVEIFPDPKKDFVSAMARCKGVISSAGHQLMSEAIVLGKPAFVIPQRQQFEQYLNARMLEQSGYGTWAPLQNLDESLSRFISEIDFYPRFPQRGQVRFSFRNELDRAVDIIDDFVAGRSHSGVGHVAA